MARSWGRSGNRWLDRFRFTRIDNVSRPADLRSRTFHSRNFRTDHPWRRLNEINCPRVRRKTALGTTWLNGERERLQFLSESPSRLRRNEQNVHLHLLRELLPLSRLHCLPTTITHGLKTSTTSPTTHLRTVGIEGSSEFPFTCARIFYLFSSVYGLLVTIPVLVFWFMRTFTLFRG